MIDRQESNCIIDRYFYESYKKMQQRKAKSLSYYVVRTFALLLIIPINHIILEQGRSESISLFTTFLIVTLAYTLLQTIFAAYFYCAYVKNRARILKIATEIHHNYLANDLKGLDSQQVDDDICLYERQESMGIRVSTIYYDFQNMQKLGDVSQQFKATRESNGCSIIRNTLESDLRCFKFFETAFMMASVFIFAFGITVSSLTPLNQTQHSLLQMVLISQVMFQPKFYAIIFLFCLSPVFILFICFYCCCCARRQIKAKLPQKLKATSESISKCAQCSICFQNFDIDDEVAVLPCSDMHIFHYSCIEGWTKIKPNCPNCRHLLA